MTAARDANTLHRRSIRLHAYNYAQAGVYFITICAIDWECLFGNISDEENRLSPEGQFVEKCWREIPVHFLDVTFDVYVIMPNHLHGILWTAGRGTACRAPQP